MKREIKLIAISLIFLLLLISTVSASSVTNIKATPEEKNITKGEIFEIKLFVSPSEEINGLAVNQSSWNPRLAECIEILPGDIFPDYIVWIGGKTIDNENGIIEHIVLSQQTPVSSDGYLATIKFRALSDGKFIMNIPPGSFDAANIGIRKNTEILSFSEPITQQIKEESTTEKSVIFDFMLPISLMVMIGITLIVILIFKKGRKLPDMEEKKESKQNIEKRNNIIRVVRDEKNRN